MDGALGSVGILCFQRFKNAVMLLDQAFRRRNLAQAEKAHPIHGGLDGFDGFPGQRAVGKLG
ncbi:hypothetical protein D3C87_1927230 [compost metagenome]